MSLFILPLLVIVAYCDLRYLRIPNWMPIAAIVLFLCLSPTLQPSELGLRCVVAFVVFGIGVAAFAAGLFGGGDVKFLPALLLFVPADQLALFCMCLSVAILAAIATVSALRSPALAGLDAWAFRVRPSGLPLGLSFAYAGFAFAALEGISMGLRSGL